PRPEQVGRLALALALGDDVDAVALDRRGGDGRGGLVPAGPGPAGTWSVSDTRRWSRRPPQRATYCSVTAVTGPVAGAGSRVEVASSSRSAAIQTRQAPSRWKPTSSTGRPVKYCTNPIRPWASSTTSSTAAALLAAGGAFEPRSQSRVAAVSPSSSITASACSWLTVSGSKPVRGTSTSPACGPLPVTTVPSTSTTAVTPT